MMARSAWNFQQLLSWVCSVPRNKKKFYCKEKVLFSMLCTSSSGSMYRKRITLLDRQQFAKFLKKKKARGTKKHSFFEKKLTEGGWKKPKMTYLDHFNQGGYPRLSQEERVRCAVVACLSRTPLTWGHAQVDLLIKYSVQSIEVTVCDWSRWDAIELAACGRCWSTVVLPTIHNWAHISCKCPLKSKKWWCGFW